VKSFWVVQVGINLILRIKVVGLAYFIPIRIPKDLVIILKEITTTTCQWSKKFNVLVV